MIKVFHLTFELEELVLFTLSIGFSLYLFLTAKKSDAAYINNETREFVYARRNGFGWKTYTKRPIDGGEEVKLKRKAFKAMKPDLEQRGIAS